MLAITDTVRNYMGEQGEVFRRGRTFFCRANIFLKGEHFFEGEQGAKSRAHKKTLGEQGEQANWANNLADSTKRDQWEKGPKNGKRLTNRCHEHQANKANKDKGEQANKVSYKTSHANPRFHTCF